MTNGLLRCAVSEILEDKTLDIQSSRIGEAKHMATKLLEKLQNEDSVAIFDRFSAEVTTKLESICMSCSSNRSPATKRAKMWSSFHRVRNEELPKMWDNFFKSLDMSRTDQLFEQMINQKLFEKAVTSHFGSLAAASTQSSRKESPVCLTKDELNVLQYIGGFVPHALLKRFERSKSHRYDGMIECLGEMAVIGEQDTDFWEYTKEWITKVNRGGLFPLNDGTFQLFIEIEKRVQELLPSVMKKPQSQEDRLKDVRENILSDENVQWQWTLISQTINSEENASWLLGEIVKLYITIRGFSIVALWIEQYKREYKQSTKKSVGLRKKLT